MNMLYLIRGVSGAGKTTLARQLCPLHNVAADDYFVSPIDGTYHFDASQLHRAHGFCYEQTVKWMNDPTVTSIAVHNTFTKESELRPYLELVNKNDNWNVTVLVVERRRENAESIHNVPSETILRQTKNLSNSLRI